MESAKYKEGSKGRIRAVSEASHELIGSIGWMWVLLLLLELTPPILGIKGVSLWTSVTTPRDLIIAW
jgi:hypothetical protein